jgi:hypothetical protein
MKTRNLWLLSVFVFSNSIVLTSVSAEQILKRGTAELIGYQSGAETFETCDHEHIKIQPNDVISDNDPTLHCPNDGPTPINLTAEVVEVNDLKGSITVKLGTNVNTFAISDKSDFKEWFGKLKPGEKMSVQSFAGFPYEPDWSQLKLQNQYIKPPSEEIPLPQDKILKIEGADHSSTISPTITQPVDQPTNSTGAKYFLAPGSSSSEKTFQEHQ